MAHFLVLESGIWSERVLVVGFLLFHLPTHIGHHSSIHDQEYNLTRRHQQTGDEESHFCEQVERRSLPKNRNSCEDGLILRVGKRQPSLGCRRQTHVKGHPPRQDWAQQQGPRNGINPKECEFSGWTRKASEALTETASQMPNHLLSREDFLWTLAPTCETWNPKI